MEKTYQFTVRNNSGRSVAATLTAEGGAVELDGMLIASITFHGDIGTCKKCRIVTGAARGLRQQLEHASKNRANRAARRRAAEAQGHPGHPRTAPLPVMKGNPMNTISIPSSLGARAPRPWFLSRVASALRRFLLADPARAAREADDIDMGIVPASRRYDRDLVRRMQRAAFRGAE